MRTSFAERTLRVLAAAALTCGVPLSALARPPATPVRQVHGNRILDGVPAPDAALNTRLAAYLDSREATFLDWLPDGSMLISTRFGRSAQIHRVTAPLGMRAQLTYYAQPVTQAAAPQTGAVKGFAFLKNLAGGGHAQVYYYDFAARRARRLTDGKSQYGHLVWSHDGRRLAFDGNARDGTDFDIYVANIGSGAQPRLVVGGQQGLWYPLDWSRDDSRLLLLHAVSAQDGRLFVADVTTGKLTALQESRHHGAIRAARFAPDGRGIYLITNAGSQFATLRYLDPVSGTSRDVTAGAARDIDAFAVSANGRYLAYVANEDGRSRLTVLDTIRKTDLAPPGLPQGVIDTLKFDPTGQRLALTLENTHSPRDVYVYDIAHNKLVRWTHSEAGPLDTNRFIPAERVYFPTWDRHDGGRRMLGAYAYGLNAPGSHPVLIDLHGGPRAQYRPGFKPFLQFLVQQLDYVVIAPNVRGSSGYGRDFMALDNGRLRGDAVRDIGALLVWIGVQPNLDRNRVALLGHGYGGYLALASLAHYNDHLRGAIVIDGITSLVPFLDRTPKYLRAQRSAEYGDVDDPDMRGFLRRNSPLDNAPSIRRPLLLVQGLADARVPAAQSQQLLARLRAQRDEVWYLAFNGEGHTLERKADRDFYLQTAAHFLQRLAASGGADQISAAR